MTVRHRVLTGVGIVALLVLVFGAVSPDPSVDFVNGGTVNLGKIDAIPVSRGIPGFGDDPAKVWAGEQAPAPSFDLSAFGPDRSFQLGDLSSEPVEGKEGTVVYLGDFEGEPMLMWADEQPVRNPWDHVYRWFMGHAGRSKLQATFDCCTYSMSEDRHGNVDIDPGIVSEYPPDGQFELQWLSVPVGTSVVAYEIDGKPWAFQRPIGRVVSLPLTHEWPLEVTFTAMGSDGTILSRIGPWTVGENWDPSGP